MRAQHQYLSKDKQHDNEEVVIGRARDFLLFNPAELPIRRRDISTLSRRCRVINEHLNGSVLII